MFISVMNFVFIGKPPYNFSDHISIYARFVANPF